MSKRSGPSAPNSSSSRIETIAKTAAIVLTGYSDWTPALVLSTGIATVALLTVCLAVIPAVTAFCDLLMDPTGRPLALFLGLIVTAALTSIACEFVGRFKRGQSSSTASTTNK